MQSGESSQEVAAAAAAAAVSGCRCETMSPEAGDCRFRALSSCSLFLSIGGEKMKKKNRPRHKSTSDSLQIGKLESITPAGAGLPLRLSKQGSDAPDVPPSSSVRSIYLTIHLLSERQHDVYFIAGQNEQHWHSTTSFLRFLKWLQCQQHVETDCFLKKHKYNYDFYPINISVTQTKQK